MAGDGLKGRRILVTRPRDQARVLARKIAACGGVPKICPMIEIEPLPPPPSGWWQGYDWMIFVSANAARMALAAGLPSRLPVRLAAIGPTTAGVLERAGLPVACQAPPPYTSESLLSRPEFTAAAGRRLLIVRGVGGRRLLGEELTRRGATVVHLALYRRQPPGSDAIAALQAGLREGVDAVLATSGEILNHLRQAAGTGLLQLLRLPLLVAGGRLARLAAQAGFSEVVTAASARDEAMLAALERYFANR